MRSLTYIGDGEHFVPGVPTTDIAADDITAEGLVSTGLYTYANTEAAAPPAENEAAAPQPENFAPAKKAKSGATPSPEPEEVTEQNGTV